MDWDSLTAGAPTVVALARLAAESWIEPRREVGSLGLEARAILFLAKDRGVIELRGSNDAFDSADRLLMVHVEVGADSVVVLKTPGNARGTMRFLEGLRELCEAGLVVHHMQREFSLAERGYSLASEMTRDGLETPLASAHPLS